MKPAFRSLAAALLGAACLFSLAACSTRELCDETTDTILRAEETETVTEAVTRSPEELLTAERENFQPE